MLTKIIKKIEFLLAFANEIVYTSQPSEES